MTKGRLQIRIETNRLQIGLDGRLLLPPLMISATQQKMGVLPFWTKCNRLLKLGRSLLEIARIKVLFS